MIEDLFTIQSIRDVRITGKTVIVRVDFDVDREDDGTITDDTRIVRNMPTLKYLLQKGNKLILLAKLGRPEGRDASLSLRPIVDLLPHYLPGYTYILADDLNEARSHAEKQSQTDIIVLENIRFFPEEESNDDSFARKLAELGDIYVADAFAMAHREESSVTGIMKHLPSYAGLLLSDEVRALSRILQKPERPFTAIMGGAKISTKIGGIRSLLSICDDIILGGALANTCLKAQGYAVGRSLIEDSEVGNAADILRDAQQSSVSVHLPEDVIVGDPGDDAVEPAVTTPDSVKDNLSILDIGPETQKKYARLISRSETIMWNGPMGLFEKKQYRKGTDCVYDAITAHPRKEIVVGGGDTLAALHGRQHNDRITHISTGGGAMLELIEKGTLPVLEALKESQAQFADGV